MGESSSEESSEDKGFTGGMAGGGFGLGGSVKADAGVGVCAAEGVLEGTGAEYEAKTRLDLAGCTGGVIRGVSGSESGSGAGSGTGLGERFWIRVEERGAMEEEDG